ncbi:hypothetical protein AB4254_11775 [Vibrio breoganii]
MSKCFAVILIMMSSGVFAADYSWERDKQLHFGVSAGIGVGSYFVFEEKRIPAYIACSSVGLAKELYDQHRYGGFDHADLAYDIAGCAVGYEVSRLIGFPGLSFFMEGEDTWGIGYTHAF